jgi:Flp pilus assembly protein TadB
VTTAERPKEDVSDMPTPTSSPWAPGSGSGSGSGSGYRRYFRPAGTEVRASDAERSEVAERLSKHYQDGRLDQTEFNERLDRAMNAKTRADFHGLFYDLPDLPDESGKAGKNGQKFDPAKMHHSQEHRMRQRSTFSYILFLAVIAIAAIVVAHTVLHSWFLWMLIAVVAFFWLRNREQARRR